MASLRRLEVAMAHGPARIVIKGDESCMGGVHGRRGPEGVARP